MLFVFLEVERVEDYELVPPDGGWGWLVLFGATLINLLVPGIIKSFGVLFVEFLETYKFSEMSASWIPALSYFLYCSLGTYIIHTKNRICIYFPSKQSHCSFFSRPLSKLPVYQIILQNCDTYWRSVRFFGNDTQLLRIFHYPFMHNVCITLDFSRSNFKPSAYQLTSKSN